jgi:hypothetical protein
MTVISRLIGIHEAVGLLRRFAKSQECKHGGYGSCLLSDQRCIPVMVSSKDRPAAQPHGLLSWHPSHYEVYSCHSMHNPFHRA